MNRSRISVLPALSLLLAAALSVRCSDNTGPVTDASGLDAFRDGGSVLVPADSGMPTDAQSADSMDSDRGTSDSGPADFGAPADTGPADTGARPDSGVPLGDPIMAPNRTWTWVDVPDSHCDDGSSTGIGVNLSDTTSNVIFYLEGGGACWDFLTCVQLGTATHGPFGQAQFMARTRALTGSIFDRTVTANPFKDWNQVYIPYCTGDIHGGSNVITYTNGTTSRVYNHVGRRNIVAFLGRLYPTFRSPGKLVLSGASAGGFGAAVNYPLVRSLWTTGQVYMLDDSGPILKGDSVPLSLRNAWFTSWHLQDVIDPVCGDRAMDCHDDFSLATTIIANRYPNDRFALLESLQDQTIRTYIMATPMQFQDALLMTAHDVLDPLPNFKYFFIPGQSHTMIGNPAAFTSRGTHLWDWLTQEVTDDPAWASTSPQ